MSKQIHAPIEIAGGGGDGDGDGDGDGKQEAEDPADVTKAELEVRKTQEYEQKIHGIRKKVYQNQTYLRVASCKLQRHSCVLLMMVCLLFFLMCFVVTFLAQNDPELWKRFLLRRVLHYK
jgi:hypothetical protein